MSESKRMSRRSFLGSSGKLAAGVFMAGALSSCETYQRAGFAGPKVLGANDRINLAVIGTRSRGNNLIDGFGGLENVRIAALCDVDGNLLERRAGEVEEKFGNKPAKYKDERKLLADKDIDAVAIATPNHWHALGTIWACQAGKHVFVEKPCCHNIWEGRKMVEAARKYKCIVGAGFHNRSIGAVREAMAFLNNGGIGEVYMARGLCLKPRDPLGLVPDGIGTGKEYEYFAGNQPGRQYDRSYMDKVDYDMWLGPAPKRPFNYNRFHYNWHWHWDYGSGDIGNQGPHQWDIARWGIGKNEHPVQISSSGGYYGKKCAQETPNTQAAQVLYADGKMIEFEVRGLYTNAEEGIRIGNLFYGTKGWLHLNGSQWQSYFGRNNEKGPGSETIEQDKFADAMNLAGASAGGHFANFIYALRTNNSKNLTCEIEEGFISSALPLLANISYRLGRNLKFVGRREKFVGDSQADKMLTRKYRKPYVVPARV